MSVWCGYPDKTDGTHSTTISVLVADAPFTPSARAMPTLIVRKGELHKVNDLISELGMFSVQTDNNPSSAEHSFAGYLIRSKSAESTEGGVHSGQGVLDSLVYSD